MVKQEQQDTAALVDSFLGWQLYVAIMSPLEGPEIDKGLYEHLQRQIALEKTGQLFGAGPLHRYGKERPTQGMMILKADSFEEAKEILEQDPFIKAGLRTYTLHRWKLAQGNFTLSFNCSDQTASLG